ncbi:Hypothetical predicted protein, partial [Mytilus galloprovincialis]
TNDMLVDEQNGFRAHRSCEDHIFTLNAIVRNCPKTFATFIDLKKAFDFVDRDMLLYKLLLNKIDGKIYNSIKSIYVNTTACIRLNDTLTDWFSCNSGVRQGDNLSPTLFSIFINDLVQEVKDLDLGVSIGNSNVSILLYADDIVLVSPNENDMQAMLNKVHDWCKRWRVLINTEKSKVVHFRQSRIKRSEYKFKIGGNSLQTVDKYKYLGVMFHELKTIK